MNSLPILFFLSAAALSAALPTVGPDYTRPAVASLAAYRDGSTAPEWKLAVPADQRGRGEWWQIFGDPELNQLEHRSLAANQDLAAAAARVDQANALARVTRSEQWPQAAVDGSVTRERQSTAVANAFPQAVFTDYNLPLVASWELDLFGRVRRLTEGARADAAAAQALFASVQLTLTADVAETYFELAGLDPARVRPTTSGEFVQPAKRPGYSVLGHAGWQRAGLEPMGQWRAELESAFAAGVFQVPAV